MKIQRMTKLKIQDAISTIAFAVFFLLGIVFINHLGAMHGVTWEWTNPMQLMAATSIALLPPAMAFGMILWNDEVMRAMHRR